MFNRSQRETVQAGMHLVAYEIYRRGGTARVEIGKDQSSGQNVVNVSFGTGDEPTIRIKTKSSTSSNWHAHLHEADVDSNTRRIWALVDVSKDEHQSSIYLVPESWIIEDIKRAHAAFLASHGGTRPVTPDSDHHAITPDRVEQWKDAWHVLLPDA
jgi:hypothetical protein